MARVQAVQRRITAIARNGVPSSNPASSRESHIRRWLFFAQRYRAAADALEDATRSHDLVRNQLYGHALECAFKAFLYSKGITPPIGKLGHDLATLAASAEKMGCLISELEAIAVVQVASLYFEDVETGSRYKARYPSAAAEPLRCIVGDFTSVAEVVASVCAQVDA